MRATPVTIAVRKQGLYERGRWSTRILTIDVETSTLCMSRKSCPEDVAYHSMEVHSVQMWPRYTPDCIESRFDSLKAKMVLRITGTLSPCSNRSSPTGSPVRSLIGSLFSSPLLKRNPTRSNASSSSQHVSQAGSYTRRRDISFSTASSPTTSAANRQTSWLVTFTTMDSYELAVMLFLCLKNADGTRRHVFTNNVVADLAWVKGAWEEQATSSNTVRAIAVTCAE